MDHRLHLRPAANMYEALAEAPKDSLPPKAITPPLTENQAINIAAEKLKRQNERIHQSDAVLDDLVKKGRGGRSSKWKPFDLRECFEGDMVDTYDENRYTPLDVHAKPFLPTPPLTLSADDGLYGDYAQYGDFLNPSRSENDDFQLITGRRLRTSGLNAYQVREDNRTPTVTASYNKKEINTVFGNDLPSPSYCQSHPGTENGQIQFCIHPNGDVSAQQWFMTQYQWINVGQYSNIRKRTEGQLANDRLRGETEGQTLQQNTLAYFHAIAKQREASVMGRPFGLKEIQACLPPADVHHASLAEDGRTDSSIGLESTMVDAKQNIVIPVPKLPNSQDRVRTALEFVTSRDTPTPMTRMQRPGRSAVAEPTGDKSYGNLTFGSMSCLIGSGQDGNSRLGSNVAITPLTSHTLPLLYGSRFQSPTTNRSHDQAYPSVASNTAATRAEYEQLSSGQSGLHDASNQLTASSRSSGTVGRTVMHDPVSQPGTSILTRGGLENPFGGPPASHLADILSSYRSPGRVETGYTRSSPHDTGDLQQSEPDAARRAETTFHTQGNLNGLSLEALELGERPTVQHLEQGFLWDPHKEYVPDVDHDAELRHWYYSGNKAARHEDLYQRILRHHSYIEATRPAHSRDPGVIGPPSRTQQTEASRESQRPFNEDMTRLLIPVMENLASYVEGPEHQRHGCWAPFTKPPEWAIDKSPNGNLSFFDDDWGKPPERIGRDQRYRPARKPSLNANEGWSPARSSRL